MREKLQVSKMTWEVDANHRTDITPARPFQVPPMIRELCGYEWTPGQLKQLLVSDFIPASARILAWANCDFDGVGTNQRMAVISTEIGLTCAYYIDGTPNRTPEEKTRDELSIEMYPQLILKN